MHFIDYAEIVIGAICEIRVIIPVVATLEISISVVSVGRKSYSHVTDMNIVR